MNNRKIRNKDFSVAEQEKQIRATQIINPDEKNVNALFQELQMHQVELEMQNDELSIANEQLEVQQLKFAGIYDLAPIGYFILDKSGIVNEVNNEGILLLETVKGRIIQTRLQSFVHPDNSDTYHRFYREMLNSGKRQNCNIIMVSGKGRELHVQLEGIAITPIPNQPVQCDIAVIDISKRIEAENSLAKTKERLELALEAASAGIWELELDTMKFYLDEYNYQTCAVPGGKFDGKYQTFISLIHPEDRHLVDQHFRSSLNAQSKIEIACRFINNNGLTCHASIRGHEISEKGKANRFVGIMMDVTDKKRMEEESSKMKDDYQKTIALATFHAEENERKRISEALHDGVSQLLYAIRIKLGELNAGGVINNINNLLDLAIQETRNISFELAPSILTDFGLPATVEELAKRLSTPQMLIKTRIVGFNKRLEMQLEISIFRIIQELINNCMKHASASLINLELRKNKLIEISVKDNGSGFITTGKKCVPAGAGLSSIKNRLSFYNGQFHIESKSGLGTTVKIDLEYIPVSKAKTTDKI